MRRRCTAFVVLLLVGCGQSTAVSTPDRSARELHYQNKKYGFSLTFNEQWKGYEVDEKQCSLIKAERETEDTHPCFIVTLPTNDSEWNTVRHPSANKRFEALYIGIFSTEQLRGAQKEVHSGEKRFAGRVFTLDAAVEYPSDVNALALETPDVIDSLEATTVD